ncbi:MAG TPA: hypothetical protein VFA56_03660, partial [Gaiellaceae bacterium]|nr:hypothetical protein [Gaiellaceae bacterium]
AASIPDVVEDLAMQTAYKLGLAAGAEHVLLTALDGQGRPNPGPNPWTCRTTVMVDEKTGGRPIRVTVDGPPGEKR